MTMHKKNQKVLRSLEKISGKPLTLGNLLWSIRKGEGMTQVSLAELLNLSKQYLCDIENDRRTVSPKMAADYANYRRYSL